MIQMILDLIDTNAPSARARIKRTASTLTSAPARVWRQLKLRLVVRKILRDTRGFLWTRPDGRQFRCRTMRQLVARIMDYDGHLLSGVLRLI
ncbi:MAG: hypothetical protein ACOY9I_04425 [Pseudomonadota bacterium]